MRTTVLAIEIFSIAIVALILYACIFEATQKNKKNRIFITLLACSLVSIGSDALSWIFTGNIAFQMFYRINIVISFVAAYVTATVLTWYLGIHVKEKHGVSFLPYKILMTVDIVATVLVLVGCCTGFFYNINDIKFYPTKHYNLYTTFQLLYVLALFVVTLVNAKKIGTHDTIVICIYMTFVPLCMLIGSRIEISYAALGLEMLFIYITLQSEREINLIEENKIAYIQAHVDELTGLNNRLSYYETLNELTDECSTGIIFCDVNGLKFTNDNLGHKSGDELLKKFADSLLSSFKKKEIYRISGDEFVVCMPQIEQTIFETRVSQFKEKLAEMEVPLAAVGSAHGIGSKVNDLISKAEENMYMDKQEFYKRYPKFKRG